MEDDRSDSKPDKEVGEAPTVPTYEDEDVKPEGTNEEEEEMDDDDEASVTIGMDDSGDSGKAESGDESSSPPKQQEDEKIASSQNKTEMKLPIASVAEETTNSRIPEGDGSESDDNTEDDVDEDADEDADEGKEKSRGEDKSPKKRPKLETVKQDESLKKDKEDIEENDRVIQCPLLQDVLVGRGETLKSHPGNQRMMSIAGIHRERFTIANEQVKQSIVKETVADVERGGTRFLKVNSSGTGWVKCSRSEIEEKILQCLLVGAGDVPMVSDALQRLGSTLPTAAANGVYAGLGSAAVLSNHPLVLDRNQVHPRNIVDEYATRGLLHPAGLSLAHSGLTMTANGELILDPNRLGRIPSHGLPAELASGQGGLSAAAILAGGGQLGNSLGGLVQGQPQLADLAGTSGISDLLRSGQLSQHLLYPELSGSGIAAQRNSAIAEARQQLDVIAASEAAEARRNSQESMQSMRSDPSDAEKESSRVIPGPPQLMDVVVGREALLYSPKGNVHLQHLVQANVGEEIIPTELKRVKAKAILERMQLIGTRFLMKKEGDPHGHWHHLTDTEAQNIIYRGLCEEEKRIRVLLLSGVPSAASLSAGPVGLDVGATGMGLPLHRFAADPSAASLHAEAGKSVNVSQERNEPEGEPRKKKYKKRLRKIAEERRRMDANSEQKPLNGNSPNKVSLVKDEKVSTPHSSETSEHVADDNKSTFVKGPVTIRQYDVILGRGRGSFNHPGNKNLIHVMRSNKARYGMASKNEKIQMARDIVTDIQRKGGRFLKRHDDETWEIISNKYAYIKVGHGIRDLKDDNDASSADTEKRDGDRKKKRDRESPQNDDSSEHSQKYLKTQRLEGLKKSQMREQKRRAEDSPDGSISEKNADGIGYAENDKEKQAQSIKNRETDAEKKGRRSSFASIQTSEGSLHPRDIDVVCGRGKAFNRHAGNKKMQEAVTKIKYHYRDAASQEEKSRIAHAVLSEIQGCGGKFLKYDESTRKWQELEYKVALKKIYHSIRDALYNDRDFQLHEETIEANRRRHDSESKNDERRRSGGREMMSGHMGRHPAWSEFSDMEKTEAAILAARHQAHRDPRLSEHSGSRMFYGGVGDNMKNQLTGMLSNGSSFGERHMSLHDGHGQEAQARGAPRMHQLPMNASAHHLEHPSWGRSVHPHGGHMSLDQYRLLNDQMHGAVRIPSSQQDHHASGSQIPGSRMQHHQQYYGARRY